MVVKILALLAPTDDIQSILLEQENVDICYVYGKKNNFLKRCFRRLSLLLGFTRVTFSHDYKGKDISSYNIIIVDEMIYQDRVIKDVREKNKQCKIVLWLWNTVDVDGGPLFYDKKHRWEILQSMRKNYNFTIASFDKKDCEKYKLTYYNQIAPVLDNITSINHKNTIYFYGRDKGRLEYLQKIYKVFSNLKLQCNFNVVPDKYKKYDVSAFNNVKRVSYCSYYDIVKEDKKSKALLEIVQSGQNGLTWRTLEALFYKKKLITNFKNIREYDFYNQHNIFILGIDDLNNLKSFLNSKYENIPETIIKKYTFKGWLENIS